MSGAGEVTGGRTWRIGNTTRVLDGDPWLMGILNVTPDSFSDGGDNAEAQAALHSPARAAEKSETASRKQHKATPARIISSPLRPATDSR